MSNINKAAVLNMSLGTIDNIVDSIPKATTSKFGIVALGSGINVDALGRIYLDTQEYSDRLAAIEAEAATTLATQKSEVATAIAQINLTQSQTIIALTLEVSNLKTNLTDSITTTQTDLINRADQLAQNITDITQQLTQDKAAFTQEIQDALVYLENEASIASALRTPRNINGTDFDGSSDITTDTWGATRSFKVGNKTNNINGAANVEYSLADIGAFPDVGGTIQGNVEVTGNISVAGTINASLEGTATSADKLRVARKIQGIDFDGTQDINLPLFSAQTDGLAPKREGSTTTKYLREDGAWVVPADTTYALLTKIAAEDGTATTANTISAQVLKEAIQYHAPTVTNIVGNAETATKLQTPRTINGVLFDGTQNISLPEAGAYSLPTASNSVLGGIKVGSGLVISNSVLSVDTLNQSTTGNAATATKLQTARTISLTGEVTGSVSFDGSANVSLTTSISKVGKIVTDGLGDKYLSDDGSYKEVSGGVGGGVSEVEVKGWISRNIAVNNAYVGGTTPPTVSGSGSLAIGLSAIANSDGAIAIGASSNGLGNQTIAIGSGARASYNGGVALGGAANASGFYATAIGLNAVSAFATTSIGNNAGAYSTTYANCSHIGNSSNTTSDNQVQLGNSSTTTYAFGVVQNRSDARDKTDIQDCTLGLDFINALRPVKYKWDYREDYARDLFPLLNREDYESDEAYQSALEQQQNDRCAFFQNPVKDGSKTRNREHHGLIAQEFKQVLDNLGLDHATYQDHSVNGGMCVKSLGYIELIPNLIKAIQDLSAKVESLENGILPSNTD